MEELLSFLVEEGGVVALLIIIVIVLWGQHRNSVPKDSFNELVSRIDGLDEDIMRGVLPAIQRLAEMEKHTQETLSELRRTQELHALLLQDTRMRRLLGRLEEEDRQTLLRGLLEERDR